MHHVPPPHATMGNPPYASRAMPQNYNFEQSPHLHDSNPYDGAKLNNLASKGRRDFYHGSQQYQHEHILRRDHDALELPKHDNPEQLRYYSTRPMPGGPRWRVQSDGETGAGNGRFKTFVDSDSYGQQPQCLTEQQGPMETINAEINSPAEYQNRNKEKENNRPNDQSRAFISGQLYDMPGEPPSQPSKLLQRKNQKDDTNRQRQPHHHQKDNLRSAVEQQLNAPEPISKLPSNHIDDIYTLQNSLPLSKMLVPPSGPGFTRCLITRDRKGLKKFHPLYNLFLQDLTNKTSQLIMIAQKQPGRTPNYRFFDMSRGLAGTGKLSKKSGNYVGKLRANYNRDEYTIFSSQTNKTSLGAVVYDKCDMVTQYRDGAQPRKMGVLLPANIRTHGVNGLTYDNTANNHSSKCSTQPASRQIEDIQSDKEAETKQTNISNAGGPWKGRASSNGGPSPEERLAAMLGILEDNAKKYEETSKADDAQAASSLKINETAHRAYQQLTTKEPVFEKGNYRLNFHGRVKLPSVKNYQLVPPEDIDDVSIGSSSLFYIHS